MNSHWPYSICVILLRSMQTFAGLRDSSLPDPCLSATHYGTTEVTINCQCTEKLNTTLSVEKRSDRKITLVLMSTMTIGQLCRHSLGRLHGLLLSVIMSPVNNWTNATSKIRVGLTSWPRRHIWLGRLCSQLISPDNSYSTCELKQNFNSKVSLRYQGLRLSTTVWCRIQSFKSTPATPTQHVHPDRTIYATTTAATDKTTTTELLDYCDNCVTFGLTI